MVGLSGCRMIKFCHTNQHYDSYDDFWRLVELCGYEIISIDDIEADNPEATYIITPINGNVKSGWPNAKARIILWNMEWTAKTGAIPGVAEIWASDRYFAHKTGARFVPVGSHPDLVAVRNTPQAAVWDVAVLAYRGPHRRGHILEQLDKRGFSLAPDGWGEARDAVLRQSRVLVHIHQHEAWPCVPVLRFAFAASAWIPVVAERCQDALPYVAGRDYMAADYDRLPAVVERFLNDGYSGDFAASMYQTACATHRFDLNVAAALGVATCAS